MESQKCRVLVVDDDRELADVIVEMLEARGFEACSVNGADDALRRVTELPVDVVLSDVEMPGKSGFDLLAELARVAPELPVILMSAGVRPHSAAAAPQRSAFDFLTKPFPGDALIDALRRALPEFGLGLHH